MTLTTPETPLIVVDADAWNDWLVNNDALSDGVWLALAKKGTTTPTSLKYQEALEEALCSGWIDGQKKSYDAHLFVQRFTPRRARSIWSQRNVELVAGLSAAGRMRDRGVAEVERAKADGRWDRAYPGAANVEIPAELDAFFVAHPAAKAAFGALSSAERYSLLHPILIASNAQLRTKRLDAVMARLA